VRYPGIEAIRACARCCAWARSAGRPCRQRVVRGRNRCWLHGGRAGAPPGHQGRLVHGRTTRAAKAERKRRVAEQAEARKRVAAAIADAGKAIRTLVRTRRKAKGNFDGTPVA
jgi:hypothetical protein